MIFDTHTDILYDIVCKRLKGKSDTVESYHIPQLLEGNITGGIWTYYTDVNQLLCDDFDLAINYIISELQHSDNIHLVKGKDEWEDHKMNVVLGLESLAPVKDLKQLRKLYDKGFRHAMLTWNEKNQYGTGVGSEKKVGLTDLGCEAVTLMNKLGMVVDVSHANVETMVDILDITTAPVIASHSNCYGLTPHKRNLTDVQIKAIAQVDGMIGVTAVPDFTDPKKPTIKSLVNHIDYIKKLVGTNYVGLGFDFMNYLVDDLENYNLDDCPNAAYANNVIDELIQRGYSSVEIDNITNRNAKRVINHILK
ncbi:MAG TPA: peptidase [Firmicutes bacterium]|nr:peptidase [Bacillota bacterium]